MSSSHNNSHPNDPEDPCPYEVLGFNDPDENQRRSHLDNLPSSQTKRDEVLRLAAKRELVFWHPDNKRTGDAEKFKITNEAYDKIKTAALRKIYSNEKSIKNLSEQEERIKEFLVNVNSNINPYHMWFCISLILLFLVSMPWIVALQIDDSLGVSWPVALIPFWIVDACILCMLMYTILSMEIRKAASGAIAATNVMCAIVCVVLMASIIIFEVFFCLKDNGDAFLEDNMILIVPLIIALCSCCVLCMLATAAHVPDSLSLSSFAHSSPAFLLRVIILTQCGIAQAIMVAIKVNGSSDRSWTHTFVPTIVCLGSLGVLHLLSCTVTCVECGHCLRLQKKIQKQATDPESQTFIQSDFDELKTSYQESLLLTLRYCIVGVVELLCLLVVVGCFVLLLIKLTDEDDDKGGEKDESISAVLVMAPVLILLAIIFLTASFLLFRNVSELRKFGGAANKDT